MEALYFPQRKTQRNNLSWNVMLDLLDLLPRLPLVFCFLRDLNCQRDHPLRSQSRFRSITQLPYAGHASRQRKSDQAQNFIYFLCWSDDWQKKGLLREINLSSLEA